MRALYSQALASAGFTDKFGWGDVFLLMAIVAVIGSFFIFPLWNLSKDGYIHDSDAK
jgi:sugar phosphate permease